MCVDFLQLCRCGWSMDLVAACCGSGDAACGQCLLYSEYARWNRYRLKTNTQSATAFRGFGGPQGMLGIERVLDHVAHAVGRDPLEVRRLNYYRAADAKGAGSGKRFGGKYSPKPEEVGVQTTHYGMPVEDFILHEMTDRLVETSDYLGRKAADFRLERRRIQYSKRALR